MTKNGKKVIVYSLFVLLIVIVFILVFQKSKQKVDENMLYQVSFGSTILKIEKYDYALGQKVLVGVEKSLNKGKTFTKVTKNLLAVSTKAQYKFLDENLGFVLSTKSLSKSNNYLGFYVTFDGGLTFNNVQINYNNSNIEIINIDTLPYRYGKALKLEGSIYINKERNDKLNFISEDNGLTWNLMEGDV